MKKVGNRVTLTVSLSPENAAWVTEVAQELDLAVSRVVNLCVEGERCSMTGSAARGLAKLAQAAKVPSSGRGGTLQGKLALEG